VNEPLKVAIAGGSLGGLMAGLELAAAGAEVRIYERSERVPDDRGAGIIQPVLDLAVPQMVFGRTVLVGDAAFIPRPHTAASTSKAASNATTLGRAITQYAGDIDAALGQWEPTQLALGRQLQAHGQTLGNRSQFGG